MADAQLIFTTGSAPAAAIAHRAAMQQEKQQQEGEEKEFDQLDSESSSCCSESDMEEQGGAGGSEEVEHEYDLAMNVGLESSELDNTCQNYSRVNYVGSDVTDDEEGDEEEEEVLGGSFYRRFGGMEYLRAERGRALASLTFGEDGREKHDLYGSADC
eukprot:m.47493 g.47493  ORF g.47493 m.47493 type:complete len:158 (-) comp14870_c0_seq1:50-523(-)